MRNINPTSVLIDPQPIIIQSRDQIKSYTYWSILNIFCCCLCLGCLACYYSNQTKDLKRMDDIQGAFNASKKARIINIIATIIGIIFIFINIPVADLGFFRGWGDHRQKSHFETRLR
jgi:hypothetical protein